MNLPLFIAKKIYYNQDIKRNVSKPAIKIAIAGVAIGLTVMIISVSVIFGFKHTIRNKVAGFGSHIQIAEFMTQQGNENNPICINDSTINLLRKTKGIKHIQKYVIRQGILKTDSDFLGVVFKGIGKDFDKTFISNNLQEGTFPFFSNKENLNSIVISRIMSQKLRLNVGDKIFAYFIDNSGIKTRRFIIKGIYQTNLSQYDKNICFANLSTIVKLNGWKKDQISGIEVTLLDFNQLDNIEKEIAENINRNTDKYGFTYSSETIQKLNPQIFKWLDLLDLNVWIILALMIVVAVITMISGLLIIILEHTNMIGTLKALGAKNKTIRFIFLWFASFIIGKGLIIGDFIACALLLLQKYTKIVKLDPNTYYVNYAPVEFNIPIFILLNIITLIICILVLIAPSYLISKISPAKSIKYD